MDTTLNGPLDWEVMREKIANLYPNQSVKQIKELLEEQDGFIASEEQYDKKLRLWIKQGIVKSKYTTRKQRDHMIRIRGTRAKIGKRTGFTINGKTFTDAKLDRYIAQTGLKEADRTSQEHCSGETPDEIDYFTPEATCSSINLGDCGDKIFKRTSHAPPQLSTKHTLGDGANFLNMMDCPTLTNVDSKDVKKNPCPSDNTLEVVSAEPPRVIGASLHYQLLQSRRSPFTSLQGTVDGSKLPNSNEINSERCSAIREQKKIASAMTPELVWSLVPSLAVTASPGDLTTRADLRQRAMKVYEKHYGRSAYDPRGMAYKSDELWEIGRYGDAEELDRLTIEVAQETLSPNHLYTLMLRGRLAAAIWDQGQLEEAEKIESEVVKKMRDILGEDNETTLQYMGNLSCTYRDQGKWQQALSLCEEVVRNAELLFGRDHQDTLSHMTNLAKMYGLQQRWADAEDILTYVSEARTKLFGADDKQTVWAFSALARALQHQGNLKEAKKLVDQVSQARKSRYRHLSLETCDSMDILAEHLFHIGQFRDSERIFRDLIQGRTNLLAARHPHTLTSKQDLVAVLYYQERIAEAETIGSEVLGIRKEVLGSRHPNTLSSMAALCCLHSTHMRLEIVEKEFSEVLELRQSILGEEHPDTLRSQSFIAWAYGQRGRWKAAEDVHTHIQQLRQKIPGIETHPDSIHTTFEIAATLQHQREPRKAEELYRRAYDLSRDKLGEEHWDTLRALSSLVFVLSEQGRYQEAEAAINEKLLAIKKKYEFLKSYQLDILRAEIHLRCQQKKWDDAARLVLQLLSQLQKFSEGVHPAIPSAKAELARVRSFQRRYIEAETLFLEALNETRSALGPMHPNTVDCLADLAWLQVRQKRWTEAVSIYNEVLITRKEILGQQHRKTISVTMDLAIVFTETRAFSEAEKLFNLVLQSRESDLGPRDPETLDAFSMIAWLRTKQSRWSDAADLYKTVLEARKQTQGRQHPDTLLTIERLAHVSIELGNLFDAENLYEQVLKSHVSFFGESHPVTLKTKRRMASLCYQQSRFLDAEQLYNVIWKGYKSNGSYHKVVAVAVSLAELSRDQCKVYQAEKEGEKAVSFGNKQLGGDHRKVRLAKLSLAKTKEELGKLSEAGVLYDEVLESESRFGGPENQERLNIMFYQGRLLGLQGKFDEAELILKRTLQGKEMLLGENDPTVLETMETLADLWRQTDKLFDAEKLQCKVLAKEKEIFGDYSLRVSYALALTGLAFIKVGQRKHIEAEELWERGLQLQKIFVVESNNNLLRNTANLACTKYRLGKFDESEDLLQRVILCREQNGDGATPTLLNDLGSLATVKYQLGKFAEAENLQIRAVKMTEMLYGYGSAKHVESLRELIIMVAKRDELEGEDRSEGERLGLEALLVEDDDDSGSNVADRAMEDPDNHEE